MFLAAPRIIYAHELLLPHQPSRVICITLVPPDLFATLQYIAFVPERGAARKLWTRASQKKLRHPSLVRRCKREYWPTSAFPKPDTDALLPFADRDFVTRSQQIY
jgi:hypothetical protein